MGIMTHLELELFTPFDKPTYSTTRSMLSFLEQEHSSLNKEDIRKALEYSIKDRPSYGGFVLLVRDGFNVKAVAILNRTGLAGIMPNYILSHFAVSSSLDNAETIRHLVIKKVLELTNGEVARLEMIDTNIDADIQCQKVRMLSTVTPSNDSEKQDAIPHRRQVE